MSVHWIELRWRGRCCRCSAELGSGELARWDDETHQVSCFDCAERAGIARRTPGAVRATPRSTPPAKRTDREQTRALIAEARAALSAARHAS